MWTCPKCTLHLDMDVRTCSACGYQADDPWQYSNDSSMEMPRLTRGLSSIVVDKSPTGAVSSNPENAKFLHPEVLEDPKKQQAMIHFAGLFSSDDITFFSPKEMAAVMAKSTYDQDEITTMKEMGLFEMNRFQYCRMVQLLSKDSSTRLSGSGSQTEVLVQAANNINRLRTYREGVGFSWRTFFAVLLGFMCLPLGVVGLLYIHVRTRAIRSRFAEFTDKAQTCVSVLHIISQDILLKSPVFCLLLVFLCSPCWVIIILMTMGVYSNATRLTLGSMYLVVGTLLAASSGLHEHKWYRENRMVLSNHLSSFVCHTSDSSVATAGSYLDVVQCRARLLTGRKAVWKIPCRALPLLLLPPVIFVGIPLFTSFMFPDWAGNLEIEDTLLFAGGSLGLTLFGLIHAVSLLVSIRELVVLLFLMAKSLTPESAIRYKVPFVDLHTENNGRAWYRIQQFRSEYTHQLSIARLQVTFAFFLAGVVMSGINIIKNLFLKSTVSSYDLGQLVMLVTLGSLVLTLTHLGSITWQLQRRTFKHLVKERQRMLAFLQARRQLPESQRESVVNAERLLNAFLGTGDGRGNSNFAGLKLMGFNVNARFKLTVAGYLVTILGTFVSQAAQGNMLKQL